MATSAEIFFRILYGTTYSFLHVLLLALLLVTPGDIINQSRTRHDIVSILIVAGAYVFAILVVTFVFFLRLFLKRAVLNSIPKSWVPIEKGDVSKPVRNMISAGLSRSAAIAFVSRPRVVPDELLDEMCPMLAAGVFMHGGRGSGGAQRDREGSAGGDIGEKEDGDDDDKQDRLEKAVRFKKVETMEMEKELGIDLPPCQAVWGAIEHPGWAPPDQVLNQSRASRAGGGGGGSGGSGAGAAPPPPPPPPTAAGGDPFDENINLQYSSVLAELPNLVEAKALTLAPPDPFSAADTPPLDADAVALLERPEYMGLREYLSHLAEIGVIDIQADAPSHEAPAPDGDPRALRDIVSSFATAYEYARFSTHLLTHDMFRQLMHDLAIILRRMTPLDPSVLEDDETDDGGYDKESAFSYSEADDQSGRPYFGQDSEDDEEDDIDNNPARSSPTTPPQSRSRHSSHLLTHHQQQQQYDPLPRHTSQLARSHSGSSGRSAETTTSSSGSSSTCSTHDSNGTSRRRRPSRQLINLDLASPSVSRSQRRAQQQPLLSPQNDNRQARRTSRINTRRPSSQPSSSNSFAQSRHPYALSSQPSSASLRSTNSSSSVIRLANRGEQSSGLPYVITTPTSQFDR
ncbi:hypothetical protein Sste5346_009236 [Sporothrix stenoceras]|uniref:Defect at low temperature protein 1 n=1 Tax=Sporothrix stenoceras TaxID=5173 RepID=A0ABR3YKV8_9PEZI